MNDQSRLRLYNTLLALRSEIPKSNWSSCHYKVGQSPNEIREALLRSLPLEERQLLEATTLPLDVEIPKKGSEDVYTIEPAEARRLYGQLERHLAAAGSAPKESPSLAVPQVRLEGTIKPQPTGKAVFIVHGHDELNLLRLRDLLRERSLEPIVLSSQPGKGRSIVEKFEEEAERAAYAFVLLTPDDNIIKSDTEYSQARPNVLFELGWFYGRLGRERVCILFKKGTRLHSDLDGISRIEFTESLVDKIAEIERELIAGHMLKRSQ